MTALDKATLLYAASAQPKPLLTSSLKTGDGNTGNFTGLNGLDGLVAKAWGAKSGLQGSWDVTIEGSANGTDFTELFAVGTLTSGSPSAVALYTGAVPAYVRVAWTATGGSKHISLSCSVVPVVGAGTPGATGATGATGAKGATGSTGPTGP